MVWICRTFKINHLNVLWLIVSCWQNFSGFHINFTLHGKPYFLFPDVLKRWSFQKNCAGIWFLYYRERWYFLCFYDFLCFFYFLLFIYDIFFPENMILHFGGKWKMIFLKKYTEMWYFLQTSWKDGLSKKGRTGTWSFLYYLERCVFSPRRWSFFPAQGERGSLSQEIHGNMMHRPAKKNRKPDI